MVWLCTMWGYEEKRLPRHKVWLFRFRYRNRRSTGEILFYGYYTPDGGEWSRKSSGRARDTAARRRMSAEERKNTPPMLGDADTVFADGNAMAAVQWRMFGGTTMRRDYNPAGENTATEGFSTISWSTSAEHVRSATSVKMFGQCFLDSFVRMPRVEKAGV